jgi:uncharacterized surface anchored protein
LIEPRSRRAIQVGALLTMASPLFAQSGRVRIRVLDATGAPVPSAEVALLGADDKPVRKMRCDSNGEVAWTDLAIGNHRFRIDCPGFKVLFFTIVAESGNEVQKDAVLQVGEVGQVVVALSGNIKKRKHWWTFWR